MLTEQTIQSALYRYLEAKGHRLITPNVYLYHKESDMISVTKANMCHEYEVKISKADLKREFTTKRIKHLRLANASYATPNYFSFAIPEALWTKIDIELPDYAGVLLVGDYGNVSMIKQPKRIHTLKLPQDRIEYLQRGLMLRYWRSRI